MAEYRVINKNEEVKFLTKEELESSNEFYPANEINIMKNMINIPAQQQQQQSSREDGPGIA